MADAVKSLDVVLRTRAELEGALQLQRSLETQIGQAKALGKDYSNLQSDLDKVNKSIEESSGDLEKHNNKSREMHILLSKVNEVIPGLGHALRAVFSPEAAGIMGGIIAIEAFVGWMKEAKKNAEDFKNTLSEEADFSEIKNAVGTLKDAMSDAAIKAGDFVDSLDQIINEKRTIADMDKDYDVQLQAQKKAMDEIAKAREREALATLQMMREQGKITPQQFAAAQSRLQGNADKESAAREVQLLQQEKAMAERDRDIAKKAVEQGKPTEVSKEDAAANADRNLQAARAQLENTKKELEEQKKLIVGEKDKPGLADKTNEARLAMEKWWSAVVGGKTDDELRRLYLNKNGEGKWDAPKEIIQYLQLAEKLGLERQKEAGLAGRIPGRENAVEAAKAEKDRADRDLKEFQSAMQKNADSVKELTAKIEELTRDLQSHQYDATVFAAKDAARAAELKAQQQKEDDETAKKNLDAAEKSGGTTAHVSVAVPPTTINTKPVLDAFKQQSAAIQAQIDALARDLANVDARSRNRP